MSIQPEKITGPLATITADLSSIFREISDTYLGFKNRAEAQAILESETQKEPPAYTPPSPFSGTPADWKTIALSAAALVLVVVVIVKATK